MPINSSIFKNYVTNEIKTFIETGSLIGDGIQSALDAGFLEVHSIELSKKHFNYCLKRFENNPRVRLWEGDSSEVLKSLLNDVIKNNKICMFWLDGHYSEGDTACGKKYSPLIEELEIIKNHSVKNHTILIDDMRCWTKKDKNYDFDIEDIKNKLLEINKDYKIEFIDSTIFKNDILVARI